MDLKTSTQVQQVSNDAANNAVYVNRNLVLKLRSALSRNASRFDKLPSDRDLVDDVVSQMTVALGSHPLYYTGGNGGKEPYKWFGSEMSAKISSANNLIDKGKFVDACLIGYLYGEEGLAKWCVPSRIIRPRGMSEQEIASIRKYSAEIAAATDVVSEFPPTTLDISGNV